MITFSQIHKLKKTKPTRYKNPSSSLRINLIATHKPRSFQNSCQFETILSNFHKSNLTELKSPFTKQKPRVFNYHNFKFFNDTPFRDQVLSKLSNSNLRISDKNLNLAVIFSYNGAIQKQVFTSKSGTLYK